MWFPVGLSLFTSQAAQAKAEAKAEEIGQSYFNAITEVLRSTRRSGGSTNHGVSPDGKRDYNALFGYGVDLFYDDFYGAYRRSSIGSAVVTKLPKACWRDLPKLMIGEDEVLGTEIAELKNVGFFAAMERADTLNRIGSFSVLVIGIPDGLELHQPLGATRAGNFDGMFFKPYSYDGIEILEQDSDPASARYGLPTIYQVQATLVNHGEYKDRETQAHRVHWSRVVHLAEGALESSIEGISALEQPWNAIVDAAKVSGSAAESYWGNAARLISLESVDGSTIGKSTTTKSGVVSEKQEKLKRNMKDFANGFERFLRLDKMKANLLQSNTPSPRHHFDVAVESVVAATGIPARILTSKSGGNVTGSEDKGTWNGLVSDRQDAWCSLWFISALKIMHNAGLITLPRGVITKWEPQSALSETEAAEVTEKKAQAFNHVATGLSQIGASDVDPESAFAAVGLDDIEINAGPANDPEQAIEEELEVA